MANPHSLSSIFLITITFSIVTILHCSASSSSSSSSSSVASDQLKFWSENVQNPMPNSILQKLSPLTKKASDYYTNILSTPNGHADANFCTLANLACTSVYSSKTRTTINIYQTPAASHPLNKNTIADPFSFFRQSLLRKGNLVRLPNVHESLPNRAFLTPQIASKIPLTHEKISKIFPQSTVGTTNKETMRDALSYCSAAAIEGETKVCPKSLEEMVGFAKSALRAQKLRALTSNINSELDPRSELMIEKMEEYTSSGEKIVACHEAYLPFAAYFCHSIASTRLYEVEFVNPKKKELGSNRMVGICHMDTSAWPKSHVAFEILKFGPGEGEACHWFTNLDLAWINGGN